MKNLKSVLEEFRKEFRTEKTIASNPNIPEITQIIVLCQEIEAFLIKTLKEAFEEVRPEKKLLLINSIAAKKGSGSHIQNVKNTWNDCLNQLDQNINNYMEEK